MADGVDFSAGLVPKTAIPPPIPSGDIDFSAGLVPRASLDAITQPSSPTQAPSGGSARLSLGPPPPKRSVAEGLITEQEERRAGMPLVLTPGGIRPVPNPTQRLWVPGAPIPRMHPMGLPGTGDDLTQTSAVEGGLPIHTPIDSSPEAQAEADRKNAVTAAALQNVTPVGGVMRAGRGVGELVESGALPPMASRGPGTALPTSEQRGQAARGLTDVLGGTGQALVSALPGAALERPIATLATAGGALAGSYGAGKLADLVGASPDTKALLQEVGGWAGGFGGGLAGAHGEAAARAAVDPEGALTEVLYKRGYLQDSQGQPIYIRSRAEAQAVAQEMLRQNPPNWRMGYQARKGMEASAAGMPEPTPEEIGRRNAAAAQQRYTDQQAAAAADEATRQASAAMRPGLPAGPAEGQPPAQPTRANVPSFANLGQPRQLQAPEPPTAGTGTLARGTSVGTQAGAESDTAFWNQAKAAAKPGTSFSEIAQRAQALKVQAQAQQRQPSPLGAVPLFSRPLVTPPEPTSQLDLGLNLPKRGEAFYSKAEQVADAKLPKSGPGDSFLATLRNNGVKAEEIADLKLDDFAGKAKVTKEEFLNAIRSRRPQLEQTALQGGDTSYEDYSTPGGRNYRETLTQYPQSEAAKRGDALGDEIAQRSADLNDEIDRHNAASPDQQAQWPDDYFDKERAAIGQLRAQRTAAEIESRPTEFKSGHWVEHPNVLAHSRESDFMTSDGMPVRHVHEWQSDLHQRGRERGYQVPPIRTLPEGFHTAKTAHGYSIVNREGVAVSGGLAPTQEDAINDFISIHNSQNANTSGVPNAPFKKSWHELAVKDSIRRAVRDGMHGMTWDTGETQADRYDLAKQVERVEYDPHTETLTARDHSGSKVLDENVKPEDIENYVGKEAAQKLHAQIENYGQGPSKDDYSIQENEDGTYDVIDQNGEVLGNEPFTSHYGAAREIRALVEHERDTEPLPTLRGLDLKVGGEGMSGFYDKMIPDFVRKYTKKWGAKVDTAEIPRGESRSDIEYAGPELTKDQVEQKWREASRTGPMEWKRTPGGSWAWYQGGRQISGAFPEVSESQTARQTISNDPMEREWKNVLDDMNRGVPFKEAMSATLHLPEAIGGKLQIKRAPLTTTVHRLNFTPEMINAIKSEGQPLYARNLQPGEDAMEAARRGAGETPPVPSRAQQAQTNVDRLKAQLEQQRAAGDSAQYHTVSQLRNAEDELASAQQAQRPALMAQHPPGNIVREILRSARDMEPRVDPGGPDRAARIMLDSSAHNLLQTLMPDQGQWLGISHHEDAGRQIANALRETADNWEKGRFGVDPQAIDNMRTLARQIDRVRDLNSDPNAPGHAGIPFVYDPKASFHEGETHGGQRALSPTGSPLDFTDVAKTEAHPAVEAARPVLQKIDADTPGLRTAELHAHLLDGNYKALGLTPEQAVSFIQYSLDVLEEHHGERVKGDIPRLAKRYIQAMRDFVATGGQSATRGTAAAATETPHRPGAGEDYGDNVPAREAPESGAGRGGGTPGPSEGLKQEPLFSKRLAAKTTDTPEFKRWFGDSKIVDAEGKPLVVYHGTTHVFNIFSPERGNVENHFGKGFYFTDDPHDVSTNYAGKGPDLTSRIETLADRLRSEDEKLTPSQAQQLAEEQLKGEGGHVMPTYVKMENPVDIRPKGGTRFELHYDEDAGDETGNAVDLWKAVNTVAHDYGSDDGQHLWSAAMEHMESPQQKYYGYAKPPRPYPSYDASDFTAHAFERALRRSLDERGFSDENGDLASGEFIRRVFQEAGFDGIKQDAYDQFGAGRAAGKPMEMAPGTSHYIAFEPNQIKSATGNQGTFDPGSSSILYSRRLPVPDKEAEALRVSPRNPSGPKAVGANDPLTNNLPADGEAIRAARNKRNEGIAQNIAARMRYYPGLRLESGRTDDVLSAFHEHAMSNLQWVHDNFPAQWREPSKLWYPTGNKLVHSWSHEYSIAPEQASSVIASQSPQKDWHMNRSLAQRIIEMYKQGNELRWSTGMRDKGREWLETTASNKKATPENVKKNVEKLRTLLNNVASKRYSDLETPIQKATWMRLWDETNNNPSYDVFAPDGSNMGPARNTDKDRTLSSVAWGTFPGIAKAISILEDGSHENISKQLGDAHKIRSFNNNLIAPNSPSGDVTIDTHAVAASLLRALSGKAKEVKHNFGSKGLTSNANGVKGAYGLYGDAYREVAENNGLLPLVEQSLTWEGIRSLFPAEYKTKENNAIIDQFWKEYANGNKSLGQTRKAIVAAAGGFKPPEWAERFLGRSRSSPSGNEASRTAGRPGNVPAAGPRGQPTGGTGRGGRGEPAGAVPAGRRGVAPSPVPQFLKRVMKR